MQDYEEMSQDELDVLALELFGPDEEYSDDQLPNGARTEIAQCIAIDPI